MRTFFILFTLVAVCHTNAQNNYPVSARTKTVIDSTYNKYLKKYKITGASIAIVDSGRIVYASGYGFADLEKKVPATEKTIYRIGSCTKAITALSILQLQEKGKVVVTNSISDYIPELKINSRYNDNNRIYIKEVMAHTSGLPCDLMNGIVCDSTPSISWVVNELNKQSTIAPRMYTHAYSNIGYGLLGEVIARTSNTSYSDYVKQNLFKPLQMNSSYIEEDTCLARGCSRGYYGDKVVREPLIRDQGAGLVHSSVQDMCNLLLMFLNNGKYNDRDIVTASSISEMTENHLAGLQLTGTKAYGYGLDIEKLKVACKNDTTYARLLGHGGNTFVFNADFRFIPELQLGAIVLTNSSGGSAITSATELLKLYVKTKTNGKTVLKKDRRSTVTPVKETLSTVDQIRGNYDLGELMISVKNPDRIKFKQGPATIKFLPKKDKSGLYRVKANLFWVVPIKIPDQEFKFVQREGATYLKVLHPSTGNENYIAQKITEKKLSPAWKERLGEYTATGPLYKCTGCLFAKMESVKIAINESGGQLTMHMEGNTRDIKKTAYLQVLSDKEAVTGGFGRGCGETVKVLANGNIYYSGFEFRKSRDDRNPVIE